MHDLGLRPSQHTYSGLIKSVITGKDVTHAMDLVLLFMLFALFSSMYKQITCFEVK